MREAPGARAPGASGLQERDLPLVVGRLEPAQERAQPRDVRQAREHRRGRAGAAAGDPGGVAQRLDEGRPGGPDRDAGAARDAGDRIGLQERLVDDEVGGRGGEPEGETRERASSVKAMLQERARPAPSTRTATSPRGASPDIGEHGRLSEQSAALQGQRIRDSHRPTGGCAKQFAYTYEMSSTPNPTVTSTASPTGRQRYRNGRCQEWLMPGPNNVLLNQAVRERVETWPASVGAPPVCE